MTDPSPRTITYRIGNRLDLDAVIDVYRASTLGERRPVDDRARMERMLAEANLVVSAWDGDQLVGISRSLTDFVYATYLWTWPFVYPISEAGSERSSSAVRAPRRRAR